MSAGKVACFEQATAAGVLQKEGITIWFCHAASRGCASASGTARTIRCG